VFIVHFVIDSVRKLLGTLSYHCDGTLSHFIL